MSAPAENLAAELTWIGGGFAPGVEVAVGADGRIATVGEAGSASTRRLPRRALLPGFVNAHSHAFQRGLRGRGERFPAGAGDFWSWREAMYELAGGLDESGFYDLCVTAFSEMRRAGITTVGEFHYLHHLGVHPQGDGDWACDELVLAAARAVGIRLVLLEAYYRTGGIGRPLEGAQRRFATPDPEAYWRQMDRLAAHLDPATQSLGAVAHSVRAATPQEIALLHAEARRRGLVFHMHVEEQRREIEECVAAYGKGPTALLRERGVLDPAFTAVHLTHTDPDDLAAFAAIGASACLCPLTEANLGDGLADLRRLRDAGGGIALGTDSNARISMLEEMRWLEYGQRLAGERRGVLRDAAGEIAPVLLAAATRGGARALGLDTGDLVPGHWADFALVDLDAPTLAGTTADTLAAALVTGTAEEVIAGTCVGGLWQERDEG